MRTLGDSKETIEVKMNKKIKRSLWFKIWQEREKIQKADDNLKDFNLQHSKTDSPVRRDFEAKTLELINEMSVEVNLDYES